MIKEGKFIIHQSSDTQRVVASHFKSGNWLISKEWRVSGDDLWKKGKGVLIPVDPIRKVNISSMHLGVILANEGSITPDEPLTEQERENDNSVDKTHSNRYSHTHHRTSAHHRHR